MIATKEDVRQAMLEHEKPSSYLVPFNKTQLGVIGKMCRQEIQFCRAVLARSRNAEDTYRVQGRIESMQGVLLSLAKNKRKECK